MVTYNPQENHLLITLPNKTIKDLHNYRASILGILSKIEIQDCNPELMGKVKFIYELLSHFQLQDDQSQSDES